MLGFLGGGERCIQEFPNRKHTVFRSDYPIRSCPAKMEFSRHLSHACLEHEYRSAYAEHLFVLPLVSTTHLIR